MKNISYTVTKIIVLQYNNITITTKMLSLPLRINTQHKNTNNYIQNNNNQSNKQEFLKIITEENKEITTEFRLLLNNLNIKKTHKIIFPTTLLLLMNFYVQLGNNNNKMDEKSIFST